MGVSISTKLGSFESIKGFCLLRQHGYLFLVILDNHGQLHTSPTAPLSLGKDWTKEDLSPDDLARVREVFDIRVPRSDNKDTIAEYMNDLVVRETRDGELETTGIRQAPYISGLHDWSVKVLENSRHLAFDIRDIDQTVMVGQPPNILEIVRGEFDPEATEDAIYDCSECERADIEERGGIEYYSWGDGLDWDLQRKLSPPAYDQFGRGGNLAVLEDYVFRTLEKRGMERLIDTYLGERDSLADNEDFLLMAETLDEMGVYSAYLTDDVEVWDENNFDDVLSDLGSVTQEEYERLRRRYLDEDTLLNPYDALAAGVGQDEDGLFTAIVLVYDNVEDTEDDVQYLEESILDWIEDGDSMFTGRPWSDYFDDFEIASEGRVLQVKLRTDRPGIWAEIIIIRGAVFLFYR